MAGMFGGDRGFGGSLGQSPMFRLAGGIGMGFGGQRFPQVMTNQLMGGRGPTSMFGGGGGGMFGGGGGGGNEPSTAAMMNYATLERGGQQAFGAQQAGLDRALEDSLLRQQLQNRLQVTGMEGRNRLDLQSLVNSGALDQIGARGDIEQALLGRRLSSEEAQLAQQLGFNREALYGNLGAQGEDRLSRERMHGAGLNNALELQSRQDQSAMERLRSQLLGQRELTGMEIGGRQQLQELVGQQQGQLQRDRGAMEMGQIRARGQLSLEELRENARNTRANLMEQLGVTERLGQGQQAVTRDLGYLNAYNQMYDTMQRGVLGQGALDNQLYGIDVNADIAEAGQEQTGYHWAQDHALRQRQAEDAAAYNRDRLIEDRRQWDNPQPLQVAPPPTRQAIMAGAWKNATEQYPDASIDELQQYVNNYMDAMDGASQQPGMPGQQPGQRRVSTEKLIRQGEATQALNALPPGQLMRELTPVLEGIKMEGGVLSDAEAEALSRRGINPFILQQLLDYKPMWEGIDANRSRYMFQRKAKPLREALLKRQ
jgi:hypothetical protein